MRVLAGDLGGTKCELVLYERAPDGRWSERTARRFASADFPGPTQVIRAFLAERTEPLDAVGLAVAGPVHATHCRFTNLDWELDASELGRELGAPVAMVNDFVANAHGLEALAPGDLLVLQEGLVDLEGPIGVIGAGTGLGHAVALRERHGMRVLPAEGGHTDFAPRDDTELSLWRFLRERHGAPVPCERAISGSGLVSIWEFVIAQELAPERADTRATMASEDPAAVVSRRALDRSDPACERALSLFLSLYGAEAGNFALKLLPTGGLYVAGGIAPRIATEIPRGEFLQAFLAKDKSRELLSRIRISIVLDPRLGLLGARTLAERSAART